MRKFLKDEEKRMLKICGRIHPSEGWMKDGGKKSKLGEHEGRFKQRRKRNPRR